MLDAYENQDVPLECITHNLKNKISENKDALFNIMFVYQNVGKKSFHFEDIEIEYIPFKSHVCLWDLLVEVQEPPNGTIEIILKYPKNLFKKDTIKKLGDNFKKMII